MAGVLLRTAGGTLLFIAFLWLVHVDDYRVAGMLLTFPMLNGIGMIGAGPNAERLAKSMMPVIALNGSMCFLLTGLLTLSSTARAHPAGLVVLAGLVWLAIYAVLEMRNVSFSTPRSLVAFAIISVISCVAITYALWPACTSAPISAVVRAGGLTGLIEGWTTILLFALSLAIFFGFAHRFQHAHAAIGRLAALPIVPLFGIYTVATALWPDPAALPKLEALRSLVLIGWMIAAVFVVIFAHYAGSTEETGPRISKKLAALILGWAICLAMIAASAKAAATMAGCS